MARKLGTYGVREDLEASNLDVAAGRARDKRESTRTERPHEVSRAILVRVVRTARTRRDATIGCPVSLHQRGRAHVQMADRAERHSATRVVTDGRAHAVEQLEGRHARTLRLFAHAARGEIAGGLRSAQ